jgi:putative pyoverdin transport system ATP-binding/permease protein
MLFKLIKFYNEEISGPKALILLMSLIASLSHGLLITVINGAVEAQANNNLDFTYLYYFIACLSVFLLGSYFAMYKATEIIGFMMHSLRIKLCEKLAKSSFHQVEKYQRGEIFGHIAIDIDILAHAALHFIKTFQASVVLIFCTFYIGWLSGIGILFLFMGLLISISAYLFQYKNAAKNQKMARDGEAKFFTTVTDELDGLKELKLNDPKMHELLDHQVKVSDQFRSHYTRSEFLFFKSFLTSQLGLFFILGLVVFVPKEWIVTETATHFQLLTVLLFALSPLEQVVDSINSITRGGVALTKIREIDRALDDAEEKRVEITSMDKSSPPAISLENISLTYRTIDNEETFKFGPLSLDLIPNEVLFVVGANGSGKTTFLKLLTGLYPPDSGEIRLNDKILSPGQIPSYRQLFSAIFTDYHLFQNLYGMPAPDIERTDQLLELFELADKTQLTGNKFSNLDLSSGQRKRLALAVLLLEDRPIVIFDEFAADQDPKFREYFYRELLPELKRQGKTVIAISHDDRYFDCCDRLIKLDLGGIVAEETKTSAK